MYQPLLISVDIHILYVGVIKVMQRDVPGIDHSFLAMDTEEGVEVVWNEVQFSERKSFKSQEVLNFCQKISSVQEVYTCK